MDFRIARPRRRRTVIGLSALGGVLLLVGAAFLVGPPLLARAARFVVERKLAEVSRTLGRSIELRSVSSGFSDALRLEGVAIRSRDGSYPLLTIQRITLDFSLWDAIMGRREPSRVVADGVRVEGRIEASGFEEWADLLRSFRRRTSADQTGPGLRSDRLPRIPRIEVSGEALWFADPKQEPALRVSDLSFVLDRDHEEWAGSASATVLGLGPQQARVTATFHAATATEFTLEVASDRPLEPTALVRDRVSIPLRLTGLTVTSRAQEGVVTLRGVEVPELVPIRERLPVPAGVSLAGLLAARDARFTFAADARTLLRSGLRDALATLRSAALSDASLHLVPADARLDPLRFRGMNAVWSSETRTLQATGEVAMGRLGYSSFDAMGFLEADGGLREVRLNLVGPLLVEALSRFHPRLLRWPGAALDVRLVARRQDGRFGVVGHVAGRGLSYYWTKLCLVPITGLSFEADLTAEVVPASGDLVLKADPIRVGPAYFTLSARVQGLRRGPPRFDVAFQIPRQPCQALAAAIPPVMIPRLQGAQFEGEAALSIAFVADLAKPERSSLSVEPDVEDCHALTLGPLVDVARLNDDRFVFEIHEKDYDKPIRVGPGTRDYVPIAEIPVVVQQAALATEDMAFFKHQGFRIGLINRAIKLNLTEGWYVYGGSTISQQLVKNLFLSREKTLARKLEEAIIVWEMERKVEKDRILELYLNCIEFGRHVYGIRAAAQTYFGKTVPELTAMDAAFIMATKPGPRYAHKVYESRVFNEWWVKRMKGILERLWREMDVIDERTAHTPDPCPPGGPRGRYLVPCFYYPGEGYQQPAVAPGTEVPPGMPENLPGAEGGGAAKPPPEGPPDAARPSPE